MQNQATSSTHDIHIAVYIDERYVPPLAVMLTSALENLQEGWRLNIHVVHAEASPIPRTIIDRLVAKHSKLSVQWFPIKVNQFSDVFISKGHISISTYFRILVGMALPANIKKVLLLDADLLVVGDLSKLWQKPLSNKMALACPDAVMPYVGLADHGMFSDLKMRDRAPYFNAGIMLVDLAAWREQQVAEGCLELARRFQGRFNWSDQCMLNAQLYGKIGLLDCGWNVQTPLPSTTFFYAPFDSTAALWRARHQPKIVHFTGPGKPWMLGSQHPWRKSFERVAQMALGEPWIIEAPPDALSENLPAGADFIKGLAYRVYRCRAKRLPWALAAIDLVFGVTWTAMTAPRHLVIGCRAIQAAARKIRTANSLKTVLT